MPELNSTYRGWSNATGVNSADATVDNDHHEFATSGYYSLSFDYVSATGVALQFARDAGDPAQFTHYAVFEFEAYRGEPVLRIERMAGDVILSWPAAATGFALEGATALGATFAPVGEAPTVEGGRNKVTVPADDPEPAV